MFRLKLLESYWFELARVAPHWFAVLVGLTYGSGFLIVYTFLDRFGIRDTGGDFFKVKYIHVGILFLLFPTSILIPLGMIISLKRAQIKSLNEAAAEHVSKQSGDGSDSDKSTVTGKNNIFRIPISAILSFSNLCAVFYVYILFTPRGFALTRQFVFPLIFVISILGPIAIDWVVNTYIVPHHSERFRRNLRWLLLIVTVAGLDYYAFHGFFIELWHIFWGEKLIPTGGIFYVVFMMLIPFTLWRANVRAKEIPTKRGKRELRIAAICLALMFYFLGILSFALRVYPAIPVAKGGGSYTDTPCVKLFFKPTVGTSLSVTNGTANFIGLSVSNGFVIIEQTPSSIFLANTNSAGGPTKWHEMRQLPGIIEVRRDSIDQIVYDQLPAIPENDDL